MEITDKEFKVFGKNSKNYSKIGNDSFGKKSLFEKINNKSTKLISFGLNRFDPTFVHYVEQFFDENFKSSLKTEKLTTRDSRAVERKKPGRKKARRSFQFSKR